MVQMKKKALRKPIIVSLGAAFLISFFTSSAQAQNQSVNPENKAVSAPTKKTKAAKKPAAASPMQYKSYKIKKGETLAKVARANGGSVDGLLKANPGLNPRKIRPGTVIKIPVTTIAKKHPKPEVVKKSEAGTQLVYRVKKGETLYSLSKKFNLSQDEIKKLNKLRDETIIAGMPLLIKTLDSEEQAEGYRIDEFDDENIDGDGDKTDEGGVDVAKEAELQYTLRDDDVKRLLNYALDFLGTTYKYGGSSTAAIDCSAYVKTVFKEVNIPLPRTSREQILLGIDVPRENLREGDLLFFAKKKRINHVAMYIGNDMYIHAARKGKGVIVSKIDNPYFRKSFVGAKRIFQLEPDKTVETKPQFKDLSLAGKPLIN